MKKMPDKAEQQNSQNEDVQASDVQETAEAEVVVEESEAAAKLKSLEERYLRLAAEYENFRRRSAREKQALYEDVQIDTVRRLLPLLDSLDRSAELSDQIKGEDKAFAEGVQLMREQALSILADLGITEVESCGAPFDPEFHHAVSQIATTEQPSQTVVEVIQKGYRLGDRLVRAALVVVAE